jgi:hypothetical protein
MTGKRYKLLNKKPIVIGLIAVLLCLPVSAFASAGWYPAVKGESITVEYCLPQRDMGNLYLQALGNGTKWKTVATIKNKILKKDKYCADEYKYGSKQGLYHLKYVWKVNISGGWGLRVKSSTINGVVYGWPDGITTEGK